MCFRNVYGMLTILWCMYSHGLAALLIRYPPLKNVPFDLIHNKGLGFIAGPLGEPKEMDDWTK